MRIMNLVFVVRMAYRHVRAGLGRTVLSITAVAVGVGVVASMLVMNEAVLQGFIDSIDGMAGRAGLIITAAGGANFSEDIVERLKTVPGVALAVPLVRAVTFPDDGSGESLTVHGVDVVNDDAVRVYETSGRHDKAAHGLFEFFNNADSILLGREFAARRGLGIGSTIDLVTPRGVKRFTIRGLLESEGLVRALAGRLVVMDLPAAELAFTDEQQINHIDVVLTKDATVEATKTAIEAALPAELSLVVEEPALKKDVLRETVGAFHRELTSFSLLAAVAGFVICYGHIQAIFESRAWEIGLLRAVGLGRGVVFAELMAESVFLGVMGTVIGLPIGILAGDRLLPVAAGSTESTLNLPVWSTGRPSLPPICAWGAAVGLMAALLAAAIPAARILRMRPVAALAYLGRELPGRRRSNVWALSTLMLLLEGLIGAQNALQLTSLGHVTTVLLAVTACALARPLVAFGSAPVGAIWSRLFGCAGRFAGRHLTQRLQRSAMSVATVGVGLGAVLFVGLVGWSCERTVVSQLTSRLRADLIVTSAFGAGGWMHAALDEGLLNDLTNIPEVVLAVGEQRREIRVNDGTAIVAAIDRACFTDNRVCQWSLLPGASADALGQVGAGQAVIVSRSFAYRHRTRPGDRLRLVSPTGTVELPVAAVTSGEPLVAVIMSRERYRPLWNDHMITWAHVAAQPGTAPVAADRVARELGMTRRLAVHRSAEVVEFFAGQARRAFGLLGVSQAIALVLILIGTGDNLVAAVLERTRELGMLRAVGLYRSQLFGMIVLESGAIAILGIGLALLTGLSLGHFWIRVQLPAVLGWKHDPYFPWKFAAVAATLTLVACLVGAIVPAVRAARLRVVDALRNE